MQGKGEEHLQSGPSVQSREQGRRICSRRDELRPTGHRESSHLLLNIIHHAESELELKLLRILQDHGSSFIAAFFLPSCPDETSGRVQVEENVAAAVDLAANGIDEELLKEVEAILVPVKNQTWPSGVQQG